MVSKAERLFGAEGLTDAPTFDPDTLVLVTDKTHPLYDPRVEFDPNPELVASVAMMGVLEPVLVRRNGSDTNGKPVMEVIDGRQRVLAARVVNAKRRAVRGADFVPVLVPAAVRRSKNDDKAFEEMVGANLRVPTDQVTESNKLARYLDDGHDEADALVVFGLPNKRALRSLLALADCSKRVQKAVACDEVTLTTARALSTLPNEEQDAELQKLRDSGRTRGKEASQQAVSKARPVRERQPPKYRTRPASEVGVALEQYRGSAESARIADVLGWVLRENERIAE